MTQPPEQPDMERLTHAVLGVLREWQVDHAAQVALLGLPQGTKARAMSRHEKGQPLPADAETLTRIKCLLEIDHAMVSAFPHNPNLAQLWVTTPARRFNDALPLQVMVEQGLPGMQAVLAHLYGQDGGW